MPVHGQNYLAEITLRSLILLEDACANISRLSFADKDNKNGT